MLVERVGHAGRRPRQLARVAGRVSRFDLLDAPLDLPHAVEILLHAPAIARVEAPGEIADLRRDVVEHARRGAAARVALLRRAARAEQLIERHPRIADHRQRLGRRGPADHVRVDARVAVRAATALVGVLDAQLHRRDGRVLPEALRVDLIERHAGAHVGALGLLRMRLREEDGARPEVIAADLGRRHRVRPPDVGVADDRQTVSERLEGTERARREIERAPGPGRRPQVLGRAPLVGARRAVHHLDADEPRAIERRRVRGPRPEAARRRHRVEKRQRDRRAEAPQHRAAGDVRSGDECHVVTSGRPLRRSARRRSSCETPARSRCPRRMRRSDGRRRPRGGRSSAPRACPRSRVAGRARTSSGFR